MNRSELEQGLSLYGTPLYLFDLDHIRETAYEFAMCSGGAYHLCYAMKANPFVTKCMQEVVDRIEVCSTGEYRICKKQSIPPEKVLISGVLKKREDIQEIMDDWRGACMYTAESPGQLKLLADWSNEHKETLRVFLRLTSGNQFGMDGEKILSILKERGKYPYLHIQGIHYFSGTQKRKVEKICREIKKLDAFIQDLEKETGFVPEELEYGPGLTFPYFEGEEDHRTEHLRTIATAINTMVYKGRITLEMGRAFAGGCGYYLTAVRDLKQNSGHAFCITDGGIHQLNYDGQIRGMYQPYLQMIPKRTTGDVKEWTVCGALCTGNDVLLQSAMVDDLTQGDVFVFERAGAYSAMEGPGLFLSHNLPKVALYDRANGYRLVRDSVPTYLLNTE